MSHSELDALAAPVDREVDASEMKPLTAAMRRQEARAKRKGPGRPRVGKGAKRVMVTMEKGLLEELTAYTRRRNVTRAAFIAQAVRAQLRRSA
jgi:hypothetical protein